MGNCLVTKLKESVDNPSLEKLGYFRVTFKKSQTDNFTDFGLYCWYPSAQTVYLHNCTYNGSNEVIMSNTELTANNFAIVEGAEEIWIYFPKYVQMNTINVNNGEYEINATEYLEYLKSINLSNCYCYGDISRLFKPMKRAVDLGETVNIIINNPKYLNNSLYGDISGLGGDFKLTPTRTQNYYAFFLQLDTNTQTKVFGSIDKLGHSMAIDGRSSYPNIPIYLNAPKGPRITLNIDNFVANAREAGAGTESVLFQGMSETKITYQGQQLSMNDFLLSWTPTTITITE